MKQIHQEALLFSQSVVFYAYWHSKINKSNKKAETKTFVDEGKEESDAYNILENFGDRSPCRRQ